MLPDNFAPYAPPANVVAIVDRFRTMELPASVSKQHLRATGVSEGNVSRVLQALEFLGLVDEERAPTQRFRDLVNAPSQALPGVWSEIVRDAYQQVLQVVNPEIDSQETVREHFQSYSPKSQTGPMTTLFLGLCSEAGMTVREAPKRRGMKAPRTRSSSRQGATPTVATPLRTTGGAPERISPDESGARWVHAHEKAEGRREDARFHKLVAGMLDELPPLGEDAPWSHKELDAWLNDLGVVLARVYKIRD